MVIVATAMSRTQLTTQAPGPVRRQMDLWFHSWDKVSGIIVTIILSSSGHWLRCFMVNIALFLPAKGPILTSGLFLFFFYLFTASCNSVIVLIWFTNTFFNLTWDHIYFMLHWSRMKHLSKRSLKLCTKTLLYFVKKHWWLKGYEK